MSDRTPFSGGSGALGRTGLPPRFALRAAVASLALGTAATGVVAGFGFLPAKAVALLVVVAALGWAYSVGPALAWRGLGEVTNALLGGLVLPLFGVAVVGGALDGRALFAVLPFTVYVFTNLLATQWPDRHADETVGKRTLPTRWPRRRLRLAHVSSTVLSFGLLAVLPAVELVPPSVGWSSLVLLPVAVVATRRYTVDRSPFPSVAVMVAMAVIQFLAWARLALLAG